jgi:trk system potassium uptake protein
VHIVVTGCGRVGAQLAQFLSYEGHDVVVIDKDENSFKRLAGGFNGVTMAGVAFDEGLLVEAGIERADALAAVTNFDNTNLMVAEIATRIFDVPTVVARLYNPEKRHIFTRLGVDFVCGTTLVAELVMGKLLQGDLIVHQERPDVGIRVLEFAVPWLGGKVKAGDLENGHSSRILALERRGRQLRWDAETRLLVGDRVVMAARREGLREVEEILDRIGVQR